MAVTKNNRAYSPTFLALTASALALPGVSGQARADAAPTNSTLAYRVSSYQEDDLPREKLISGSRQRYDIDIHQLQLMTPIGENYSLSLDASYESMSGASPWYVLQQTENQAGVVMSGATISEQRRDLVVNARRYLDNGSVSATLGVSRENDYDSISGGISGERHFDNNLLTLAAGVSFSSDDIEPTDAELFGRITEASKTSQSVFLSASRILNQSSLFQTSLNITHLSGFLSDPYKLGDRRPESRTQVAWSNAYRKFFIGVEGALHLNYRLYHDNFGIDSHTLDAAWYQNLGDNFQLVPSIRYYSQSEADFFYPTLQLTFAPVDFQSHDYRLSSYTALSTGLKLVATLQGWNLSLGVERYNSDADGSLFDFSGPESPGLVDFTRLSFGIEKAF